jgi:hypothetical protein
MSNQEKTLLTKPNSTYYMVGDSTSTDNNRKYVLDARGYWSISKVKSRKSLLTKPNSTYYTVCDSTSIDNGNTYLIDAPVFKSLPPLERTGTRSYLDAPETD